MIFPRPPLINRPTASLGSLERKKNEIKPNETNRTEPNRIDPKRHTTEPNPNDTQLKRNRNNQTTSKRYRNETKRNGTNLSVEENGNVLSAAGGQRLSEALQGGRVPLVVAVGEVQSRHVHAGVDQGPQGFHAPAGGTEGADDLALPPGLIAVREDLVLAGSGKSNKFKQEECVKKCVSLWCVCVLWKMCKEA